ncbi:hypothetical protein C8F01DRAFT_989300 [Mycena amicta]|nr:hypothetical protein C8F01DRAFT_989300 [Mycena amicta]
MGFFHHHSDEAKAYEEVTQAPHKAALSHELIAAAASYEAAKAYEKHCAENGKPDNHAKAKEIMAGFAGAFIDRMVDRDQRGELRVAGLDYVDKEKAKHQGELACFRTPEHEFNTDFVPVFPLRLQPTRSTRRSSRSTGGRVLVAEVTRNTDGTKSAKGRM